MKTCLKPSPPAARCPVPAKLPEPDVIVIDRHYTSFTYQARIPLRRRPSKARLRAVQRILSVSEDELYRQCTEYMRDDHGMYSSGAVGDDVTLILRALGLIGLHRKPGQHAGEKGKR